MRSIFQTYFAKKDRAGVSPIGYTDIYVMCHWWQCVGSVMSEVAENKKG